jgi:hypothetical protein
MIRVPTQRDHHMADGAVNYVRGYNAVRELPGHGNIKMTAPCLPCAGTYGGGRGAGEVTQAATSSTLTR